MSEMTKLAEKYGLANPTTPEDIETRWDKVLTFGDRVLLAGYLYSLDGKSYFRAVYEFLDDDEHSCESLIGLREVSEERFEDNGHAIEWALKQK
ncbi:hypothetical protein O6R05_05295 [Peptoniphilus equinus]|uniref:Nucleotide modification associated domain-containing protein n=1 Tax=Peptoniphilus equinus TaxID=3016343 RepID=A0ABY7QT08_9FIRM|nr:hypothetical protein [Peptoniphilus equinus]WBW49425.1 hypothetical protein O6R05_05295 [Peptoniphilus equinus]